MPRLHETLETRLPIDDAFAYIADFANAPFWDPGVATSERLDGDVSAPVAVGTRYRLGVRIGGKVSPMEYRVTALEVPNRVVLEGAGSGVTAVDEIRFSPAADGGTHIDYVADIRLGGAMRLVKPLLGGTFRKLAANAIGGMRATLDQRAGAGAGAADVAARFAL